MAKETIQAVRQAEQKAAQIEKDAVQKAEAIVMQAKEEAKEMVTSMTKEALAKAQKDLEAAQLQGAAYKSSALKKAEQEIGRLNELVKNKEEAVINLVLAEVV